jgi:A/G-specific adenine glycosylase
MDLDLVRESLLAWYDAHRRDLPWRAAAGESGDPYHVWVSEIMLQQTRVEAVKGYYARWLDRFPTVTALAEASQEEVLKAWEGLGYYSRARNLHRAAGIVAERFAGHVPDDPESFRGLPGVGRYTAGAVMSIAFERPEPLVDGNVRRVFARWMDEPEPKDAALWELAGTLVPGERPGDLNQALMELGATVCTPRSPDCGACPVRSHCAAFAAGTQDERPLPRRTKPLPHHHEAVAIVERDGRILLTRRPQDALLGGLWDFPAVRRAPREALSAAAVRAAREVAGVEVRPTEELSPIDHTFTHMKVTYHPVRCDWIAGEGAPHGCERVVWAEPGELERFAMSLAFRRMVAGLRLPLSSSVIPAHAGIQGR